MSKDDFKPFVSSVEVLYHEMFIMPSSVYLKMSVDEKAAFDALYSSLRVFKMFLVE